MPSEPNRLFSARSESAHIAEDTTTAPSDGTHLVETAQVVEPTRHPPAHAPWTDILGDDRDLHKKETRQPAATQKTQLAVTQKGEDCTHCGDTHPTVSGAGSRGSCSEKAPEPTTPQRAQGYHCPSCFKCWEVGEEMPHGGLCTCSAHSQLLEGSCSSDAARAVLGFRVAARVVNDAKIREQLCYAVNNQAECIGCITWFDEKMNTSGLPPPVRDLFEGPLSEMLSELKNHHEIIYVLTEWAAQAGLEVPTESNPTRNDLHCISTSHRGDTHPTVQEGTLPPTNPPTQPPPPLPFNPPPNCPTIRSIMEHYNAGCVFNNESQQWSVPETHHLDLINKFHWTNMLGFGVQFPPGTSIASIVPTFYLDEPDHNQQNRPRLDILISFIRGEIYGETVRYHPRAHLICSSSQQPTQAMQNRYNLREKLRRKMENARR